MFYDLITNWVLIIPLCCWGAAQLIKMILALIQGKGFDIGYLVSSGGMPSAHSAMVSSLATAVAMTDGLASATFAICVVFSAIVMYDAAGVRQSVGQQSVVLNRIIRELRQREPMVKIESDLRELMGHTRFEVLVGGILGIVIAWAWLFIAGL